MTAEIAILNKAAVAIAADSAVTISVGENQQKVYDSEDKLFELSRHDAIGIMINNSMHFMEAPLSGVIKRYRGQCGRFDKVDDAAMDFLGHLHSFGATASADVARRSVEAALTPVLNVVRQRTAEKIQERLFTEEPEGPEWFKHLRERVLSEQTEAMHRAIKTLPETETLGDQQGNGLIDEVIATLLSDLFSDLTAEHEAALKDLMYEVLSRRVPMSQHTGVIFAGFGRGDLFPTLLSYEVFGMVGGKLRFYRTNHVDVDRDGVRAKVIPFAQKEMVERFLYGLDDSIQRRITDFCKQAVPKIRDMTIGTLDMPDDDREALETDMRQAEEAFLDSLREETFETIRAQSQQEIEDMVEFMPKSEMGKMAEALVNLTSIKRRVSRGMETVGGPIDVAVISPGDGFVWVKRKHYFPQELNSRFFDRMREHTSNKEA